MTQSDKFFEESSEQSLIKAEIVAKYFWAWAKAILPSARRRGLNIAYIDLFSGPGRYKDGEKSTPILVLERAVKDPQMENSLVTIFNDKVAENSSDLKDSIEKIPGIENLHHQPSVHNIEIGSEIVKMFKNMQLVPTLFFVDPWGYKGLSLSLIGSFLKSWGSDCIFFFNYNRINMGLNNPKVKEHMDALFGEDRAEKLRKRLEGLDPIEREFEILEAITKSLKELGGEYVLPFTFSRENGERTSHHLIFVSKHPLGYRIMKDIMSKYSTKAPQGVPSFGYSLATKRQPLLFELAKPLDALCEMLLDDFSGQTHNMNQVYENHNIGKPYIKVNYKDALNHLEAEGKIIANPPAEKRAKRLGKVTFADHVVVTFPKR